uniref:Uncharacterized protein n=1 Tax=Panagrolaimus superbus TaxID=310955 RepID=A0A914Z8H3_9BILA
MFVIDTLDPIKILCECLQKDLYSITRLQTDLDYTLEALAELQDGYGYNVKKFLETAECRKDDEVVPCTIELLKDIAVQVRLPMTDFIKNRNPDGYPSAETFQFTRNSRQLHLDVVRDHLIPGLIEELKSNFPENPEFLKQLNALDPRHLPTGGNTDAITGYAEDLRPVARRFGVNSFAVVEECISFLLL